MPLTNRIVVPLLIVFLLCPISQMFGASHRSRDHWIEDRLRRELAADERMAAVRVEAERGIVHLSGSVKRLEDKRDAGKIAKRVSRVDGVMNFIKVHTERVPDSVLHKHLGQLMRQNQLEGVRIKAKNGHITLAGELNSVEAHERALQLIGSTPGVRAISDRIRTPG